MTLINRSRTNQLATEAATEILDQLKKNEAEKKNPNQDQKQHDQKRYPHQALRQDNPMLLLLLPPPCPKSHQAVSIKRTKTRKKKLSWMACFKVMKKNAVKMTYFKMMMIKI